MKGSVWWYLGGRIVLSNRFWKVVVNLRNISERLEDQIVAGVPGKSDTPGTLIHLQEH